MGLRTACLLVLTVLVVVVHGCHVGSIPTGEQIGGGGTDNTLLAVTLPPGLNPRLVEQRRGAEFDRARLSLDKIVGGLSQPGYLKGETGGGVEAGGADATGEPPLEAQHAYLAGRLAWREHQTFEAIHQLQRARELAPGAPQVLRLLGEVYAVGSANMVRAGVYLKQAVALDASDTESLFRLGRIAGTRGDREEAIVVMAHAVGLSQRGDDPALGTLLRYYLGSALVQEGYDAAAVEEFSAFFESFPGFDQTTAHLRELAILHSQRGLIWQTVGDAHHRLGESAAALTAYQHAMALEKDRPYPLVQRLVYTYTKIGRPDGAVRTVLGYLERKGAGEAGLNLVRYVADQGADREGLAAGLQRLYAGGQKRGTLAVVVAELLEVDAANRFLTGHLSEQPGDRAVFKYLIRRQLAGEGGGGGSDEQVRSALRTTIETISQVPGAAREYTTILIEAAGGPEKVIRAFQELPEPFVNQPISQAVAGLLLAGAGRTDEAQVQFRQAIQEDPRLEAARVGLARLLTDRGDYEQAGGLLEPLKDRMNLQVVRLRVLILSRTGHLDEAIALLDRMMAQYPVNVDLVIEMVNLQLANQQVAEAERTLLDALNTQPREERLYQLLVDLYDPNRTLRPTRSEQRYRWLIQRMIETIPHARVTRIERAKLLLGSGHPEQAESVLRMLVEEDPHDPRSLALLLQLLAQSDRHEEAGVLLGDRLGDQDVPLPLLNVAFGYFRHVQDREKIVEVGGRMIGAMLTRVPRDLVALDLVFRVVSESGGRAVVEAVLEQLLTDKPEDRDLLALAQRHYQRVGREQRALELTERLILLQPDTPKRAEGLATFYLHVGRPAEAVRVLEGLTEYPPGRARPVVNLLAQALADAGEPGRAEQVFRDAVDRYADQSADLMFDWAMLSDRMGDKDGAEAIMRDLLEKHPGHALTKNALGYAWANRGQNLQQAQRMIREAIEDQPNNAAFLDSMGWVLYKRGRFDEAVTWLQRARAAPGGDYPVILNHLGDAMFRAGQLDGAVSVWRDAQKGLEQMTGPARDSELKGLKERLENKIQSVKDHTDPEDLADVPTADVDQPSQDRSPVSLPEPDERVAPPTVNPAAEREPASSP